MSPSADLLDNLINLQLPFSAKKKKKTKLDTGEEITLAAVAGVDSPANEGPAHRCEVCSQQASVGLNWHEAPDQTVFSYLREGEDHAHRPGHSQHDFAFPLGLADAQRVEYGWLPVQANDHSHKRAGVHRHQLHEHQQPAGDVPRLPLHRDVPHRVHRHHDESHQQVRHRQVHYQDPDVWLALAAVARSPEHDQVAHGGHRAQSEGDDDSDFGRGGESGQLERVSISAPIAHGRESRAAVIQRLIRQLVEHDDHRRDTNNDPGCSQTFCVFSMNFNCWHWERGKKKQKTKNMTTEMLSPCHAARQQHLYPDCWHMQL